MIEYRNVIKDNNSSKPQVIFKFKVLSIHNTPLKYICHIPINEIPWYSSHQRPAAKPDDECQGKHLMNVKLNKTCGSKEIYPTYPNAITHKMTNFINQINMTFI